MIKGGGNGVLRWAIYLIVLEMVYFMFFNPKMILILLPILCIILYYLIYKKKNKPLPSSLEPTTTFRQALWKEILNDLNTGIVVVNKNGRILWKNKAISTWFEKPNVKIKHLKDFVSPDIVKTLGDEEEVRDIEFQNRHFSIKSVMLETGSKKPNSGFRAYYFRDITELYDLKQQYRQGESVICYLYVDNFDEILVACSEENRPELLAKIDKNITQWVHDFNGLIKKYDSDKYLVIMSLGDFIRAEEEKFNILDTIREIKVGTGMNVTLSIGAAYGEGSLTLSGKTAQSALELCLGRGGDQVVVKTQGKTYFYGGKTKEVEKYSRVRARVISHALKDLIEESDMVIVLGHLFLDMDALGAGVGIVSAVRSLGKSAYIILTPNQNPSVDSLMELLLSDKEMKNSFMSEAEAFERITRKTLLVVVDTHRPSLSMSPKVLDKAERVVVIDHHRRGEEFIDKALLVYLEPYASSTSEMVTELIQYMGDEIKLTPLAATAMLAGISVDTLNFAFKTGVRTFQAASFLRRAGADPTTVFTLFQEDVEMVHARADVVKRAQRIKEHIAISYYDKKPKNPTLAAAQAANSLIELKGISASFVLVPTDEGISVSGRSLGNINVQRILEKLGGGGHMAVAGAQLPKMTMDEALEKVKQSVLEYIKEGETL